MALEKEALHKLIRKLKNHHSLTKKEIKELLNELHLNIDTLHHITAHDEKTGLYNYSFFKEMSAIEVARAERGKPLSLVIADIDHFKKINEIYGHVFADMLLKRVSTVLLKTSRSYDIVARFGGEEFLIMLLDTSLRKAKISAENLRKAILDDVVLSRYKLTISFGVASFKKRDNLDILMERADKALFKAKKEGRNLVRS